MLGESPKYSTTYTCEMLKSFFLCLAAAAFVQANVLNDASGNAPERNQGVQPANYVNIGGHFYYFSPPTSYITVLEAMEFCNFDGMKLISLETQEKNEMITDYMKSAGLDGQNYWTSGQKFGNKWQWAGSGQLFSFTSWGFMQPDDTNPSVCAFFLAGKWYDYKCAGEFSFICE